MIHQPSQILLQLMLDRQLVVVPESLQDGVWIGVAGAMSPDGDRFIALNDSTPYVEGRLMRGPVVEHPRIQLLLRAPDRPTGYDKGKDLEWNFFNKIGSELGWLNTTLDGMLYTITAVHVLVPLSWLGQEKDNRRQMFSTNLQMEIAEP